MSDQMIALLRADLRAAELRSVAMHQKEAPRHSVFVGAASHSGAFLLQALEEHGWQLRKVETSSADETRRRDIAERQWGSDPQKWPAWVCTTCDQLNSGWSLECGRCEGARVVAPEVKP